MIICCHRRLPVMAVTEQPYLCICRCYMGCVVCVCLYGLVYWMEIYTWFVQVENATSVFESFWTDVRMNIFHIHSIRLPWCNHHLRRNQNRLVWIRQPESVDASLLLHCITSNHPLFGICPCASLCFCFPLSTPRLWDTIFGPRIEHWCALLA